MLSIHVLHAEGAERIAAAVRALAPERRVAACARAEELGDGLGDVEVLFATYPPAGSWAGAARLRLVQLLSAGADLLLPAPDLPPGVRVAGLGDSFATETSVHALACLLASCRALPTLCLRQAARQWRPFASPTLAGSTLGVLGLGAVGARVARLGAAFGMHVLGLRREARPTAGVDEVFGPEGLGEILRRADYLVVALPLTPATRGLLDARALALLRPSAVLVNVARGALVDEAALDARLREGRLGGAALDAFAEEPLPPESGLWDAPNTLVTPHVAGLGRRYVERAAAVLVDNVARLERGEPLLHGIDRATGYRARD
ncbi:MAG: D-2-hydroxyacid dehydrogenase [Myxococcales bacterium]|nr:D-2-hydroxyacid dehydrogenase [Myxococcales bacterium]